MDGQSQMSGHDIMNQVGIRVNQLFKDQLRADRKGRSNVSLSQLPLEFALLMMEYFKHCMNRFSSYSPLLNDSV